MRIVSLVPSITEALTQLGLADQIVGVTDYCVHPEEVVQGKDRIGGTKDPDLERIAALRPDLVIANTDEQRQETLAALDEAPYDVLVTETDSLQDVLATWVHLGDATGTEETAERERHRLEVAIEAARTHVRDYGRLATLVPVWKSPWMAAGGHTYLGDLLSTCGFDNLLDVLDQKWVRFEPTPDRDEAARHQAQSGPFQGQTVHALPRIPDAVLLPSEPYAFEERDRGTFTDLRIPDSHVVLVDGELLTWWLSKSVEALGAFTGLHETLLRQTNPPPGTRTVQR